MNLPIYTRAILILIISFAYFYVTPIGYSKTFKIATLAPDNSYWLEKLREGTRKIELQTNGRVKFKFYPGGVMGEDKSIYRKIRVGQLHGAIVTNGSLARTFPDIQLYSLLMKFSDLNEVDYIRKKMDKKLIEGLSKSSVIPMGFAEMVLPTLCLNTK